MAMVGVLRRRIPSASASMRRSMWYSIRARGRVLEALRFARWPGQWYAEWQGPPPYTTVAIKKGRNTVGRVYCGNTKLRNGGPWGKLRFESEQRFAWKDARPLEEFRTRLPQRCFGVQCSVRGELPATSRGSNGRFRR